MRLALTSKPGVLEPSWRYYYYYNYYSLLTQASPS